MMSQIYHQISLRLYLPTILCCVLAPHGLPMFLCMVQGTDSQAATLFLRLAGSAAAGGGDLQVIE